MSVSADYIELLGFQLKESRNNVARTQEELEYHMARARILKDKLRKLGICTFCCERPIGEGNKSLCVPCTQREDS